MKKIGIYAGTFDPIHEGHLQFARAALESGLEKVMFLVEPRPRRKQGVHALEHRIAMVQLAVAVNTGLGVIVLEQARFTPHETLPVLARRFRGYELVLLFGEDVITYMVEHISGWPHIEELVDSASLMIAARKQEQPRLQERLHVLKTEHNLPFRYGFVEPELTNISSSKIRLAIKHRQPTIGLPTKVASYIKKHGLYESGEIIS